MYNLKEFYRPSPIFKLIFIITHPHFQLFFFDLFFLTIFNTLTIKTSFYLSTQPSIFRMQNVPPPPICLNQLYQNKPSTFENIPDKNKNSTNLLPQNVTFYLDQTIVILLPLLTIFIGLYQNHRKTRKKFSVHDSNISPFLVALSLCASLLSAVSILGPTSMIFNQENWFLIGLSYPIFTLITVYIIIPKLKGYDSIFSVIEKTYGKFVQKSCMVVYIFMSIYYSSGILMACCKSVKSLFNIDIAVVILTVGLIITVFTSFGGLRSVIYIDAFQGICMIGILAFIINLIFCKIWTEADFNEVYDFSYSWLKIDDTGWFFENFLGGNT